MDRKFLRSALISGMTVFAYTGCGDSEATFSSSKGGAQSTRGSLADGDATARSSDDAKYVAAGNAPEEFASASIPKESSESANASSTQNETPEISGQDIVGSASSESSADESTASTGPEQPPELVGSSTADSMTDPNNLEEPVVIDSTPLNPPAVVKPAGETVLTENEISALGQCGSEWENPPFSDDQMASPKVVSILEFNENGAVLYQDEGDTAAPELVLVNIAVKNSNQGSINLTNSNGWYCLNVTAKVINNFVIEQDCDSQLAIVSKNTQTSGAFNIVKTNCQP